MRDPRMPDPTCSRARLNTTPGSQVHTCGTVTCRRENCGDDSRGGARSGRESGEHGVADERRSIVGGDFAAVHGS
jgi:uncharacterized UBP type Zn finger protein